MIKNIKQKIFYLSLVLISLVSLVGALVYYFYSFNKLGVIISLCLVLILFLALLSFLKKINYSINDIEKKYNHHKFKIKNGNAFLLLLYFIFFIISLLALISSQTSQSIVSPWEVVPNYFFISYGLATLILALIALKKIKNSVLLLVLHSFLSFSVLLLVFRLGYGYDPFIHQATLKLIKEKGMVLPKPLYYLGQYSLVFLLHKVTFISISSLDKLLVPILSAFYLPATVYLFLKEKFNNAPQIFLSILLLLILPFSFFTLTVPQNLSFIFLILTIFFTLKAKEKKEFVLPALLALTTLIIHPLAGIPAMLFLAFLVVYNLPFRKTKRIIYGIIFLAVIISLPLSFHLLENLNPIGEVPAQELGAGEEKIFTLPEIRALGEENFILNFVYFFKFNFWIVLSVLIIASLIVAYKKRVKDRKLAVCAFFFVCLFASYFLTRQIDFDFLISYERQNYSQRILYASIIFLLPLFSIIFYKIIEKILKQNKFIKISALVFFTLLITASLYASYPRKDNYYNSHSFSAGENDLEAVNWIEQNAQGGYIVLANQQVSVAALSQFGFSKYCKNNIYFYPIPTGGPLYRYYLDMVYKKPSEKTMEAAMDLAGVDMGFFVLNKYWWAFDKILEEAKAEADSFSEIAQGEIYIFTYKK